MNQPTCRNLTLGHARFDTLSGELAIDGRSTRLRPRTAMLLAHLVRHAGRIVTKDELMQAVWPDAVVTEDSLVQCVKEIRHALGDAGHGWIRTVPRQGYAVVVTTGDAAPMPAADLSAVSPSPAQPASAGPRPGVASARTDAPSRLRWRAAAWLLVPVVLAALAWHDWSTSPDEPSSIVVLPIANLTDDPTRELATEDLTESLATALGRQPGLLVIAPGTALTFKGKSIDVRRVGADIGVRYVVEGSLRTAAGLPVLSLRLTDAASARQLWSDEFGIGDGVQGIQDEVRERIARSLSLRLARVEARRSHGQAPHDPVVIEQLIRVRGMLRWAGRDQDIVMQAQSLLEDTIRRDDSSAEAWTLLVKTLLHNVRFSPTRTERLRRADEASARALSLAPDSVEAQIMRAWVLYESRRMPEALAAFERGMQLAPHVPHLLAGHGAALIMLGRPDEAIGSIDMALRLSPRDPFASDWMMFHGVADLHAGRAADAAAWLRRSVQSNAASPFGHLMLAGAFGSAGQVDAAREQMAHFRRLLPGFTLRDFRAREPSDAPAFLEQRERLYQGLRAAGMPE